MLPLQLVWVMVVVVEPSTFFSWSLHFCFICGDLSNPGTSLFSVNMAEFLKERKGKIWRFSDWGMRTLAYEIQKASRAHYILMNFELGAKWIDDFKNMLDQDERVIRHLVMKRDMAETEDCPPPPEFRTLHAGTDDEDEEDMDDSDDDYDEDEEDMDDYNDDEDMDDEGEDDTEMYDDNTIILVDDDNDEETLGTSRRLDTRKKAKTKAKV